MQVLRRRTAQKPRLGARIDSAQPLAQKCVGFWLFNEGTGSLVNDLARGNAAACQAVPTWSGGLSGAAVTLLGSGSQYFLIPKSAAYAPAGGAITLEVVFRCTSAPTSNTSILGCEMPNGVSIEVNAAGKLLWENYDGSTDSYYITPSSIVGTGWHTAHLVISKTGGTMLCYLDGLQVASVAASSYSNGGTSPWYMGYRPDDNAYFAGQISLARIYSAALAPAEIAALIAEPYGMVAPTNLQRILSTSTLPPAAATGLSATNAAAPVLTWTSGANSTSVAVKRSLVSGGPYTTLLTGVTGSTYIDISAVPGQTYYYVVTSHNAVGDAANSNQAPAFTPPTAPGSLSVTALGNGTVTVGWGAATGGGLLTYNIYDGTAPGAEGGVAVATGLTALTKTLSGLTNGQALSLFVTAQNAAGEGVHSNETTATPSASSGGGRRITSGLF